MTIKVSSEGVKTVKKPSKRSKDEPSEIKESLFGKGTKLWHQFFIKKFKWAKLQNEYLSAQKIVSVFQDTLLKDIT